MFFAVDNDSVRAIAAQVWRCDYPRSWGADVSQETLDSFNKEIAARGERTELELVTPSGSDIFRIRIPL
jgi:hypothetical protein